MGKTQEAYRRAFSGAPAVVTGLLIKLLAKAANTATGRKVCLDTVART